MTNGEIKAGSKVTFVAGSNVAGDLLTQVWTVVRVGTSKRTGAPAALLKGVDYYGRSRRFLATLDTLELAY